MEYETALREAGVSTQVKKYDGSIHGFIEENNPEYDNLDNVASKSPEQERYARDTETYIDYSLQNGDNRPSLRDMCVEIETCVGAIKAECAERGYTLSKMAPMGVSAGGTLAMNYAYTKADTSAIPVAFVFQVAAPTDFDPEYWDILKKADHIQNDADFVSLMTGETITDEMINSGEYEQYIDAISPARLVGETSVPTLCCYGAKDHVVPLNQKYLLFHALKKSCVTYDYIEFPHSNHGMYADTDKLQEFIDLSLDYCHRFFAE